MKHFFFLDYHCVASMAEQTKPLCCLVLRKLRHEFALIRIQVLEGRGPRGLDHSLPRFCSCVRRYWATQQRVTLPAATANISGPSFALILRSNSLNLPRSVSLANRSSSFARRWNKTSTASDFRAGVIILLNQAPRTT